MFCLQRSHPACECFLKKSFLQRRVVSTSPNHQLEEHPSSAVHDCLFNIFAATFIIGGRSSICNLRTRHAVVTGNHNMGRKYMCVCVCIYIYIGCPRRNVPDFGRVFLMLKHTDITKNNYVQSWTVKEIRAREKCSLLAGPRTVPVSWKSYPFRPWV